MSIKRFDIDPLIQPLDQQHTILTPNNRSVSAILQEYGALKNKQRNGENSWLKPQVFAIDIWLQQLWQQAAANGIVPFFELDLLDRFNEQFIWVNILRSSFNDFPLLNIEEAAASVARSYQFYNQWKLSSDSEIENYRNAKDFKVFLNWSDQFQEFCQSNQLCNLTDASSLIISHLDELQHLLPKNLLLVNFTQPPPLYSELFDALSNHVELSESNGPALGKGAEFKPSALNTDTTKRFQFSNAAEEVEACVSWCLEQSEENKEAHIGIVMAHGLALEPIVEQEFFRRMSLADMGEQNSPPPFNRLSSNESFIETKIASFALAILELNNEQIETERFCRLLQSSNLIAADQEMQARIALEIKLRNSVEAICRLSSLQEFMGKESSSYYCPILAGKLLQFTELKRRASHRQSAQQWADLFQQQLQLMGWPGSSSNTVQQRQWQQINDQLGASSKSLGLLDFAAASRALKMLLKRNKQKVEHNPHLQISLLGIDEAVDFKFSHMWILGVDEKSWPSTTNPVSFLPYYLQAKHNMPGASNQLQLELAQTQLLLSRKATSGQYVLSHHQFDEELKLRASALSNSIPITEVPEALRNLPEPFAAQKLEIVQEALHIPIKPEEKPSGGSGLLSNQSNCPFRAFASNRLKARKLPEFELGLTPIARGNAMHLALEMLGKSLDSLSKLQLSSSAQREAAISESVEAAIGLLKKSFPETMTPAFSDLESTRLRNLLQGFLELESSRSEFSILATEEKISWTHSKLSLNFRIDRIDQLQDGSIALIDFKTGKKVNYKWFDQRPDDMQLPLYQLAIAENSNHNVSATLILQINAENIALLGTTDADNIHPDLKTLAKSRSYDGDWPQLQARWNSIIHSLIEEFENGLLAIAPTRGSLTCRYCDYHSLCRISEFDQLSFVPVEEQA